jgi:hypothetical protein
MKRTLFKSTFLTVAVTMLQLDCQTDPAKAQIRAMGQEVLKIEPSPDMPKADAEKVMEFYFQTKISGCGFPGGLKDEGEYWTAVPQIGLTGTPHKDAVRLHKRSGQTSWGSGPSFQSLDALVRSTR